MTRVLVTGATGFVGRQLASRLAGFDVVAAVRTPGLQIAGTRTVDVGPIGGATRWGDALAGVDVVVHMAAIAHRGDAFQRDNRALYAEVNVSGTIALAEAAAGAGVRDFIFMSTVGVHGLSTDGRAPFNEEDAFDPRSVYAESKVAAERGLSEISARTGLACAMIRAPLIHGRGAPGNLEALARAIGKGLPLPFASVANRRAFLGIDNLSGFIRHRLGSAAGGAAAFIVADEEQVTTPMFITLLTEALGRTPRLFKFPPPLLAGALTVIGRGAMAEGLLSSLEVDTGRARALGWRPLVSLADGLRWSFSGRAAGAAPQ